VESSEPTAPAESEAPASPEPTAPAAELDEPATASPRVLREASEVSFAQVRDAWTEILEVVEKAKRTAWMVVVTAKPLEWRDGGILVLAFPSQNDVNALKQPSAPGEGVGDHLKRAMVEVLGVEPKLIARVADAPDPAPASPSRPAAATSAPAAAAAPAASGWAVASIPTGDLDGSDGSDTDTEPEPVESAAPTESAAPSLAAGGPAADLPEPRDEDAPPADDEPPFDDLPPTDSALDEGTPASAASPEAVSAPAAPAPPTAAARPASAPAPQRYGEAVVRDVLKASFIEEQQVAPRVTPRPSDE
jgi:DNA polymerase-3 subunit gamma/tau